MTRITLRSAPNCPLCLREVSLTFHHLIPRKVHRRARFKKNFSREELNRGLYICRLCHRGIHKRFDEMTLAERFNDLASLQRDPQLARHFEWVAKQKEVSRS